MKQAGKPFHTAETPQEQHVITQSGLDAQMAGFLSEWAGGGEIYSHKCAPCREDEGANINYLQLTAINY
jgi:hypothetical protein